MCKGAQALKTLGLSRSATADELKTAFRTLAKKWHPDKHQGNSRPAAEERFKELQNAYQLLSAPGGLREATTGPPRSQAEAGAAGFSTSHARRRATGDRRTGRAGDENWWGDEKRYGAAHHSGYNPHGGGYMGFNGKQGDQHWYEDTAKAAKEVDDSRMVRSWISIALFGAGLYACSSSSMRDRKAKEKGEVVDAWYAFHRRDGRGVFLRMAPLSRVGSVPLCAQVQSEHAPLGEAPAAHVQGPDALVAHPSQAARDGVQCQHGAPGPAEAVAHNRRPQGRRRLPSEGARPPLIARARHGEATLRARLCGSAEPMFGRPSARRVRALRPPHASETRVYRHTARVYRT